MAPTLEHLFARGRDFNPGAPASAFASEWTEPTNYAFTILLLVGGDVINRALAQLAGGLFTPVSFSFGWVSYATSCVCTALGECKLMPASDTPSCLINGRNGYVRGNNSWVLGRMMRDYETWMGNAVFTKTQSLLEARWAFEKSKAEQKVPGSGSTVPRPDQAGLVVSVWEASATKKAGKPGHDLVYWSGVLVSIVQLGIAAIPCGISGNWSLLMLLGSGMALCLITGSLRQWAVEKWACRRLETRDAKKNFILTRGNGAQHAIAILSRGRGLDLEDLATGFDNLDKPSISVYSQLATVFLGFLWVAFLITASANTNDTWYMIAVGGIGMLQNIFVAGWRRTPEALGVPLDFVEVIGEVKVMRTLLEVERKYEHLGKSMLGTFFPGDLRENEVKEWDAIAEEWKAKKAMTKDEN